MPYSSIKDLPKGVKNVLPVSAQKIWMEVFNSSYDKHHDEERAITAAWSAVKNAGYKKQKDGKWAKNYKLSESVEVVVYI